MSQDVLWLIVCRTYPVNITILFDNIDLILLFYNSILSLNRLNSRSYESVMVSLVLINSVFLSCDSTMILAEKARGQHHAVCVYYSFFYNLALIIDYPVFLGHFLIQLFFYICNGNNTNAVFLFLSPKFAAQNLMKLKPNWRLRILALRHKNHKSKISHAQSPDSLIRFVFDDSVNNHPLCNCHRKYFPKPYPSPFRIQIVVYTLKNFRCEPRLYVYPCD